jgi:hypothetical protein
VVGSSCASAPQGGGQRDAARDSHPASFVGTYGGEFRIGAGASLPVVLTLFADGNAATSDGNDFAGASGTGNFNAAGRGRWERVAERRYRATILELVSDASGQSRGPAKIRSEGTFDASMQTITGVVQIVLPSGVTRRDSVTFTARRLQVEPIQR